MSQASGRQQGVVVTEVMSVSPELCLSPLR